MSTSTSNETGQPAAMDRAVLAAKVDELARKRPWFHHFSLPHGVETRTEYTVTDGKNRRKWDRLLPLLEAFEVKGRRILDVGCSEGFYSFKLAEMGASGTGIDVDPVCIERANFIREVLQYEQFTFSQASIYSEEFNSLPSFDLALCLGFLHRIPDPYTAVVKLSERCDAILFEWKTFRHPLVEGPFAYMKPLEVNEDNPFATRYWSLSFESLEWILRRQGYKYFRRIYDEHSSRAILLAGRSPNKAFTSHKSDIIRKNRIFKVLDQTKHYLKLVLKTLIHG